MKYTFPFVIQQLFSSKNVIDSNNLKMTFLSYTGIKNHLIKSFRDKNSKDEL